MYTGQPVLFIDEEKNVGKPKPIKKGSLEVIVA